jgi:exopolysaccharide biosynthesis polyprenyl glycosylphosphotransferase
MLRSANLQTQIPIAKSNSNFSLAFSERKMLLALVDIAIVTSIAIATLNWKIPPTNSWSLTTLAQQSIWILTMVALWLVWQFLNDMYELRMAVKLRRTWKRVGVGAIAISLIYIIYAFILPGDSYSSVVGNSKLYPLLSIAFTAGSIGLWRTIYKLCFGAAHSRERIAIYGAGYSGAAIAEALKYHPHYEIVGFIDDNIDLHKARVREVPVVGDRETLTKQFVERGKVDAIVLAISSPIEDTLLHLLTSCHDRGISVVPMPVLYEQVTGKIAVEHIGSQWFAALPMRRNSFDTFNRIGKRLLDIICALIIGTILVTIFPFVALAIRLDSPGPVFYMQERVGLYGKKFMVCKFRSMVQNAEVNGKAQWAVKGDSRITKVGQFMRKTRIDELPQIINVLRGEMSMVGPRPERQQFIDKLQEQIPFYRSRLAAKPGLTGWAQVKYGYGATVEDALIKLQYDLYYLKHCSPWLDFKILLRTFGVVIKMQGQ